MRFEVVGVVDEDDDGERRERVFVDPQSGPNVEMELTVNEAAKLMRQLQEALDMLGYDVVMVGKKKG